MVSESKNFYLGITVFRDFRKLMDDANYQPIPDDWMIGIADIVDSTSAIRRNEYKSVNAAGAAVIAAVTNALSHQSFPFVFGGDGASIAIASENLNSARDAMSATATWVRDVFQLEMRIALVPVSAIRAHGQDIRIARYGPSPDVSYAMFTGGGLSWADTAAKRGEFAVQLNLDGALPDLSGLSCRFQKMHSKHGVILSIIIIPTLIGSHESFRSLIENLIAMIEASNQAGSPVPERGPSLRWPPEDWDIALHARTRGPAIFRKMWIQIYAVFSYLAMRYGVPFGHYSPNRYLRELVANTDFRKYDDGLRMTLDCSEEVADHIEQSLNSAVRENVAYSGLHRQNEALITCFTPSTSRSDHIHFIDGANGGYALAALALKSRQSAKSSIPHLPCNISQDVP